MGLFNKQDTSKVADNFREKFTGEINEFLVQGEEIEDIYQLFVDYLCVTNKRIIFVDKVISLKEPKTTIYSVPYKNIISVGLEKNLKGLAFTDKLEIVTKGAVHELKFVRLLVDIKTIYNQIVQKIL